MTKVFVVELDEFDHDVSIYGVYTTLDLALEASSRAAGELQGEYDEGDGGRYTLTVCFDPSSAIAPPRVFLADDSGQVYDQWLIWETTLVETVDQIDPAATGRSER